MGFPDWDTKPVPGVALSAGGLLALADLSTVAQRTAVAGGSSWLDSIVLVPGLHMEQAADSLLGTGGQGAGPTDLISAVETLENGQSTTFAIRNAATANYIRRSARPGQTVTLDVGCLPTARIRNPKARFRMSRSPSGMHATVWAEDDMPDLGWLSHVLYLTSPVLTLVAFAFLVLLRDWWSVASLVGLFLARVLNIWVIKARSRHPDPPHHDDHSSTTTSCTTPSSPGTADEASHRLTEYIISLDPLTQSKIRLRGRPDDLEAITKKTWLRAKTHVEGYLEAAAKLIVYLVAALSGNMTQVGAFIFMGLLLVSAGLLALSNAHAKGFRINGRVAAPLPDGDEGEKRRARDGVKGDPPYPIKRRRDGRGEESYQNTTSWPGSSDVSGFSAMDDWAEKGQVGGKIGEHFPFNKEVEFR